MCVGVYIFRLVSKEVHSSVGGIRYGECVSDGALMLSLFTHSYQPPLIPGDWWM